MTKREDARYRRAAAMPALPAEGLGRFGEYHVGRPSEVILTRAFRDR